MHLQCVQSLRFGNSIYMDAYVCDRSAHARITRKNKDQWKRVLLYISADHLSATLAHREG